MLLLTCYYLSVTSYFSLLKLRTKLQFPGCQKSLISKKPDITQSGLIISLRSQWLCRLWCQIIPDAISWMRTGVCFKDSLDQLHSTLNPQSAISNTCILTCTYVFYFYTYFSIGNQKKKKEKTNQKSLSSTHN